MRIELFQNQEFDEQLDIKTIDNIKNYRRSRIMVERKR